MLDLNHPRTQIIFQASAYIDRLKNHCGKYTVEDFKARQNIFEDMIQITHEFEEFYNLNFEENKEDVKNILNIIRTEINLKKVINKKTDKGKCKVCNGKLFEYKSLIKEFGVFYYCDGCPNIIVENLNKLESVTGAIFI